ncbi:hypothetical protein [Parvicella tangerina]|nr:hypothetical protein [Parvicella tangerina]
MTIFGVLLFFFIQDQQRFRIIGGLMFIAGAIMISRGIKNPQQNKNRKPDIRKRYKAEKKKESSNEVH